jgi:serine/threonine protein kinase/formylglycine-generating enzyme required for sulfatase activity
MKDDRFHADFEDVAPIGAGGMAEVRRVLDRRLGRHLAMKVLHPDSMGSDASLARFVTEARTTAQLQHPGIVPVHALGNLGDGRPFFTMQEVRGRTLDALIAAVHEASGRGDWASTADGWTFRRLVDVLLRVCETMSYAHDRGVVHRDLKPPNVIVGASGEVVVLDWGIARVLGSTDLAREGVRDDFATQDGDVAGTPCYMPPEQAFGDLDRVDPRSDVWALGAMLHEILSGEPPFYGMNPIAAIRATMKGPPPPLAPHRRRPPELIAICVAAMSMDPADRYRDARVLGEEIRAWMDGTKRRIQARQVVRRALDAEASRDALRDRARRLRDEAADLVAHLPPWAPEDEKAASWAREDEAERLESEADTLDGRIDEDLHAALRIDPSLPEANAGLADRLRTRHAEAEDRRDTLGAAHAEASLRAHAESLPDEHPIRLRSVAWLAGEGTLTLVTDPPGATVWVHRYEPYRRRLAPRLHKQLGPTPIRAASLPFGSYVCEIRHPERATVRYPVRIGRLEHWDGVPPGGSATQPIRLPRPGEIDATEVLVPAGWFIAGGDPGAVDSLSRRRMWAESFVIRRDPVTLGELIGFLDDLVARGQADEALRHVPRERPGTRGEAGAMVLGRNARGRFVLRPDADGDAWRSDWPAMMVDWSTAVAYARWSADRDGLPWRLCAELEWEKAARGVDGRFFPWGDRFDPTFCSMRQSGPGRGTPTPIDAFPVDESPYGVRGMSGNMRDWCADAWVPSEDAHRTSIVAVPWPPEADDRPRVDRGGCWFDAAINLHLAGRRRNAPDIRGSYLGFRLARTVR